MLDRKVWSSPFNIAFEAGDDAVNHGTGVRAVGAVGGIRPSFIRLR
jgi:hypothetical protein